MSTLTMHGVSTTRTPGQLATETFYSPMSRRRIVQWDYRALDGTLYGGFALTVADARALAEQQSGERIGGAPAAAPAAPTTHSHDCRKAFGRFDASCPRCRELMAGAPRRQGWRGNIERYSRTPVAESYCFCPDTPLSADRCPRCGKRPYTD